MSRSVFLTTDEAVEYLMSLEDEEVDEPQMVIVLPIPDAVSDCEDRDDDRTQREPTRVLTDEVPTEDIAGTVEVIAIQGNQGERVPSPQKPKWVRSAPRYPKFSQTQGAMSRLHIEEVLACKTPTELFELMMIEMFDIIVVESNKYASQQNYHGLNLTVPELKQFIGILLLSGYNCLPREPMYWENAPDISTKIAFSTLSRNRYSEIKRFLHFNDNTKIVKEDRFFKVRTLYNALNKSLQQFGGFSEHLTIHERMVRYFGRHGCKMYMKGKPVKFGYLQIVGIGFT
jgi:hypothetical protein